MAIKKRKIKLLLVEDDPNLSEVIKDLLDLAGYEIKLCRDGAEAYLYFKKFTFDICLIDVMMPKMDGFVLAEEIRRLNRDVPIIFLTAKSMNEDKVRGFKVGCDDYITKPFSTEELVLRIDAVMKRCLNKERLDYNEKEISFKFASLTFNYTNMMLTGKNNFSLKMTKKECELLKFFLDRRNRIVTREETLMAVWGTDSYFIGRSMDVFVTKLRKYLKVEPKIKIENIHGIGFKFEIAE